MFKSKLKLALGLALLAATTALAQTQTNTPAGTNAVTPVAPPAATQTATNPAAPAGTAFDDWVKSVKNPVSWLSWGADVRLRNEYVDNAATLSDHGARHEQDYFRFRERLWASIMPVTNLAVNGRLAAEPREWMKPSNAGQYGPRSGFEERYGILDTANVKWSSIANQPLTLTGGRQDIALGDQDDWWLVADGTPVDGSWTSFFDSIRTSYEAKTIDTKFDAIYIYQNALPDEWIPTIGRSGTSTLLNGTTKPYYLTEQNEQGVILYVSNKSIRKTQIDGYFIYKGDHRIEQISNGDDSDIYTVGAKITGTPAEHWFYSAEGAYQFGSKNDPTVQSIYTDSARRELSAYAGKCKLTYFFKDKLNNQLSLVGEFLSGDDPNTKGKDEMFDILWGRYPRWTEMGSWFYAGETGGRPMQLNNVGRVGPSWSVNPVKDMTFIATYNALFAPESTSTRVLGSSATRFSDDGNFRGHFLQTTLKYQFTKNLSAQIKDEFLWEGDYYKQRDLMTFIRTELTLTF